MTGVTTQPADAASALPFPAGAPAPAQAAAPSLHRNFSWTFAGYAAQAACQWGMLIVLAKLGSREIVGQYAWGLAVTAPVMLFASLQLREVQATDAREQFQFGHYLAVRLVCTLAALAAIGVIVAFVSQPRETIAVVLLLALAKALDAFTDILFGLMQRREHMKPMAAALVVNGVVSLVAMAVAMALTGSVVWAAAGSVVGSASALWVAAREAPRSQAPLRPLWDGAAMRRLVVLAAPLGVFALLVSLNSNMPRYFIERVYGERELGVYAAMAYLVAAGITVTTSLAQSGAARLSRHFAAGDIAAFCRLLLKMMGVGGALGLAGVAVAALAGGPLLGTLYRPEYAVAAPAFVWVMVAATLAYVASFLNTAMVTVRAVRAQPVLMVFVTAVSFGSCALLVPRYGLNGAAWAAGVTFLVHLAGAAAIVGFVVIRLRRRAHGSPRA
jgi:O-antigen/teichoic acid export membrane protein